MKTQNHKYIKIRNASIHNLKDIDIDIPKNKITVITGPSGSGKSSLAFDTLFVEGQKRFIESLFSSSRHYLEKFGTSSVEKITGLTPSISVEQKTKNLGPRSTVGTQTEIYDYLRVLYSKISTKGDQNFSLSRNSNEITEYIHNNPPDTIVNLIQKINKKYFKKYINKGFEKIYKNFKIMSYDENDLDEEHLFFVINRFKIKNKSNTLRKLDNLLESFSEDLFLVIDNDPKNILLICDSQNNKSSQKITPQNFSYNSPYGYCQFCKGLGEEDSINLQNLIKEPDLPITKGGISLFTKEESIIKKMTEVFISEYLKKSIETTTINLLSKKQANELLYGTKTELRYKFNFNKSKYDFLDKFPGLFNYILNIYKENDIKDEHNLISKKECQKCLGARLNPESLNYKINNLNIYELSMLEVSDLIKEISKFKLTKNQKIISAPLIKEIQKRLNFLENIGLSYLQLNRVANSLSGGETQRIKIATQLGSSLSGVTYVLDEPSIGLHPKDNKKLINTLKTLKNNNNTIVIVEHDCDIIENADHVIDIGPKAGEYGGEVIATGTPLEISKNINSLTGKYLFKSLNYKNKNSLISNKYIEIKKINIRNIKNQNVQFPLNSITTITGVSGSGKSTLTHEVISKAIKTQVSNKNLKHLYSNNNFYEKITGYENIKQVIHLDQKPIGRSNKSNPSTYLGFFTLIRELYASTPEAKLKGMKAKHFSFNLKDGRCSECDGNGEIKVEMQFLPDVRLKCKICNGKRYSNKILNIKYKNHDISQVLNLTVAEAYKLFSNHSKINHYLKTLVNIGLGYIKLGQSSITISGGEAQRLKIAKELSKKVKGNTLYILDEPSTGLHFSDVELLKNCITELKNSGHTIIVIEHNSDIVSLSDYVIEMGPGGGKNGGKVVFQGSIADLKKSKSSITKDYI